MTTTTNGHHNATHNHIISLANATCQWGGLMGFFWAFGTVSSATSHLHHHFDALRHRYVIFKKIFYSTNWLFNKITRMSYENVNERSPQRNHITLADTTCQWEWFNEFFGHSGQLPVPHHNYTTSSTCLFYFIAIIFIYLTILDYEYVVYRNNRQLPVSILRQLNIV
jgi:hypothetical protein